MRPIHRTSKQTSVFLSRNIDILIYILTNDNNVDLTDEQMMTSFDTDDDSKEQFSGLSSELGHTIA